MKISLRPYRYTFTIAFFSTLKELQDLASQHELISENIRERSIKQIQNTVKECREQRKKCLDEYAKIKRQLDKQHELMIKVRLPKHFFHPHPLEYQHHTVRQLDHKAFKSPL